MKDQNDSKFERFQKLFRKMHFIQIKNFYISSLGDT